MDLKVTYLGAYLVGMNVECCMDGARNLGPGFRVSGYHGVEHLVTVKGIWRMSLSRVKHFKTGQIRTTQK